MKEVTKFKKGTCKNEKITFENFKFQFGRYTLATAERKANARPKPPKVPYFLPNFELLGVLYHRLIII